MNAHTFLYFLFELLNDRLLLENGRGNSGCEDIVRLQMPIPGKQPLTVGMKDGTEYMVLISTSADDEMPNNPHYQPADELSPRS